MACRVANWRVANLIIGHNEEVDVAVHVGFPDGERALQVRPAEVLSKDRPCARDQLPQNRVELGVDSRTRHLKPIPILSGVRRLPGWRSSNHFRAQARCVET